MKMRPKRVWVAGAMVLAAALVQAQTPPEDLTEKGELVVRGERHAYVMRYLPVSSFPELPARAAAELTRRGCRIPQTWQAHRPENVMRANLEAPGSQDWAALCSAEGRVSLLVFLASQKEPLVLVEVAERDRMRPIGVGIRYGFGWGIDQATPEQVHQAQAGLQPRPERLAHDALADTIVEGKTVYRYFAHGTWSVLAGQN